jgi:hypothetical protein
VAHQPGSVHGDHEQRRQQLDGRVGDAHRPRRAWGGDADGQSGAKNRTFDSSPVIVSAVTTWTQVSVGFEHLCAMSATSAAWCFGDGS